MDSDIDDDILNEILNDDNTKDKKKQTKSPLNTNNDDTNKSVNSVEENKNQNVPKKRLMQELFLDDTKEKSEPLITAKKEVVVDKKKTMNFDDDILSGMDNSRSPGNARGKNKSSIMDDLFGKPTSSGGGSGKEGNFMDGLVNGGANKDRRGQENDFVLDSKYAKSNLDDKSSVFSGVSGDSSQNLAPASRRRRGNPEMKPAGAAPPTQESKPQGQGQSMQKSNELPDDNPFPWMSKKPTTPPQPRQAPPTGQSVTSSIMQGSAGGMMGMPGYGTAGGAPAVQQPTDHVNLMNMMQAKSVNIQPMHFTSNLNVNPEFMTKEMEAFDQMLNQRRHEQATMMEAQQRQLQHAILQMQERQNQLNEQQAMHGQQMLARMQQQMEEEAINKQRMMVQQLQLMSRMSMESNGGTGPDFQAFQKSNEKAKRNLDDENPELKELVDKKVNDMKAIYEAKEERMIENYEQVIKDLEHKLNLSNEKYRTLVEDSREEKEQLNQDHRKELRTIKENHEETVRDLRQEYLVVIDRLKELWRSELQNQEEHTNQKLNISELANNLDQNTKDMMDMKTKVEKNMIKQMDSRELKIQDQEQQLKFLQETLKSQQENSEKEREKLLNLLQELRKELNQKQIAVDSERREISLAKKEFDMEKEAFKDEKEGLLEGLSKERRKFNEEREKGLLEISRIKSELVNQQKKISEAKHLYYIQKRLNPQGETCDHNDELSAEREELDGIIKALEHEKDGVRREKEKNKKSKQKLTQEKNKLELQKRELVGTVEKLYEVDGAIQDRLHEIEVGRQRLEKMKEDNSQHLNLEANLEEKMLAAMEEIQETLVDIMKTEQRIKAERINLTTEKKQMERLQIKGCQNCANIRRAFSVKDLRKEGGRMNLEPEAVGGWFDPRAGYGSTTHLGHQHAERGRSPVAAGWMDLDPATIQRGINLSRGNIRSRDSGDGASFETIDQVHINNIRKDSESDRRFLKEEEEYLKSVQRINMNTVNKYI